MRQHNAITADDEKTIRSVLEAHQASEDAAVAAAAEMGQWKAIRKTAEEMSDLLQASDDDTPLKKAGGPPKKASKPPRPGTGSWKRNYAGSEESKSTTNTRADATAGSSRRPKATTVHGCREERPNSVLAPSFTSFQIRLKYRILHPS